MAPLTASCSISVTSVSLAGRSSVEADLVLCMRTKEVYLHCPWYFDFVPSVDGPHLAEKVLYNKCQSGDQFEKAVEPWVDIFQKISQ